MQVSYNQPCILHNTRLGIQKESQIAASGTVDSGRVSNSKSRAVWKTLKNCSRVTSVDLSSKAAASTNDESEIPHTFSWSLHVTYKSLIIMNLESVAHKRRIMALPPELFRPIIQPFQRSQSSLRHIFSMQDS